jgi:TRAP transporter 4TM/12TM fusion protein
MPTSWNWRAKFATLVAVLWTSYTLACLFNLFFYFGLIIYPTANRAIHVALITTLVFLTHPLEKDSDTLAWFDAVAILFIFVSSGYIVLYAGTLIFAWGDATPLQMILGIGLTLCLLEATRRTINWILPLIILIFFFYTAYSNYFPSFLRSTGFSYPRTVGWMYLSAEGIWGTIVGVVADVVSGFVIFGAFLKVSGASDFFIRLAMSVAGKVRGGPAKVAVVASAFMGMVSGSVVANVVTIGSVTIPLMKENGYTKEFAGSVESCSSTAGMFTPPVMGATAFLIAEFLNISYWTVCLAAAIPALIYYIVLFCQVDLEALKLGLSGLPKEKVPSLSATLRGGWQFFVPIGVLLVLLGWLDYSPQRAVMFSIVSLLVVSFFNKKTRFNSRNLFSAMESSAKGMLSITPLCAAIGIILGSLMLTGAGINLSSGLLSLSGGNTFFLLLLSAIASLILGMGMTAVTCYILTVALMGPALIKLGIEPIAAHMFLFYYGTISFITPPVSVGAYVAAGIAGGNPWQTGLRACLLGSAAFVVPWSFAYHPQLLLIGSIGRILYESALCTLGALFLAPAIVGFLWVSQSRIRMWERLLLGVSSVILIGPFSDYLIILGSILCIGTITLKSILSSRRAARVQRSVSTF